MSSGGSQFPQNAIGFRSLICAYVQMQSMMIKRMKSLSTNVCHVNPGAFILLQFQMGQITQVGEAIANVVSQLNKIINNSVGNLRAGG